MFCQVAHFRARPENTMTIIPRLLRSFALVLAATFTFVSATSSHAFLSPPLQGVAEFVNDNTKRRLLLVAGAEMNFVESGLAGPGWRRSGLSFNVLAKS